MQVSGSQCPPTAWEIVRFSANVFLVGGDAHLIPPAGASRTARPCVVDSGFFRQFSGTAAQGAEVNGEEEPVL